MLKEHDVEYVDLRFTDPRGKWQHTAQHVSTVDEDMLTDGIMFDGSSIAGWKAINESDMILMPDPDTAVMDPFAAQPTLIMFCDILEPSTGQPYSRDPRSTAKQAEAYLKPVRHRRHRLFRPGSRVLRLRRRALRRRHATRASTSSTSRKAPTTAAPNYEAGNIGHRPAVKGGYFPVPPVDIAAGHARRNADHHGRNGRASRKAPPRSGADPARARHEIRHADQRCADNVQIYKYVVQQVAHAYGKTATFMPKPVYGDNGSGMHVHQSIWKDGKPLFAGYGYADLSETALYYIGGIIKHAKAHQRLHQPVDQQLQAPGPGLRGAGAAGLLGAQPFGVLPHPVRASPKGKRVEVRFPDPTANPYLAFAAMLMAGLDGIENKIHPGDPMDKNLYDLPPEELKDVPTVCGSLREALDALDADRDFLKKGDVFNDDQIDGYIELKWEEVYASSTRRIRSN